MHANHPKALLLAEKIADLRGLIGVEVDLEEAVLIIHTDSGFCPAELACTERIIPQSETCTQTQLWWAEPEQRTLQAKEYLHLYHGRDNPQEELEDWGSKGPVFGPYESIQVTYGSHIKMHTGAGFDDLVWQDELVYYDGIYYGDMEVFSSEKEIKSTPYQKEKSNLPQNKEKNDECQTAC